MKQCITVRTNIHNFFAINLIMDIIIIITENRMHKNDTKRIIKHDWKWRRISEKGKNKRKYHNKCFLKT